MGQVNASIVFIDKIGFEKYMYDQTNGTTTYIIAMEKEDNGIVFVVGHGKMRHELVKGESFKRLPSAQYRGCAGLQGTLNIAKIAKGNQPLGLYNRLHIIYKPMTPNLFDLLFSLMQDYFPGREIKKDN